VVNSGRAAPRRSACDTSHASGGCWAADDGLRWRDHAIDTGDRQFLAKFEAQRANHGHERKDSDSPEHNIRSLFAELTLHLRVHQRKRYRTFRPVSIIMELPARMECVPVYNSPDSLCARCAAIIGRGSAVSWLLDPGFESKKDS
jgi:hypothetical protein